MQTTGEAVIQAAPNRAELSLSVTTSASTARAAAGQNAASVKQVSDAVRAVMGKAGTYKTVSYSLDPEYDSTPKQKIVGYRASNSLEVKLDDLSLLGSLIDAALQAGATDAGGVQFTLRDPDSVTNEALAEAAVKARTSGEAIATALHLHVTGVLSAQTTSSTFAPRPMGLVFKRAISAPTELTPGNLDVRASVTVTLAVE